MGFEGLGLRDLVFAVQSPKDNILLSRVSLILIAWIAVLASKGLDYEIRAYITTRP